MLEAVVEEKEVVAFFLELAALYVAVGADTEHYAILKTKFHEFDFIAGAVGALVAAGEDADAFALAEKAFGEEDYHGGFAGAADGEIADADDGSAEAFGFESTLRIEAGAETREVAVNYRGGPQEETQPRRQSHRAAPPRCWAGCWPRSWAMAARARSSAP